MGLLDKNLTTNTSNQGTVCETISYEEAKKLSEEKPVAAMYITEEEYEALDNAITLLVDIYNRLQENR